MTSYHNQRYLKSIPEKERDNHFCLLITKGIRIKDTYRVYVQNTFNVIQFYIRKIIIILKIKTI